MLNRYGLIDIDKLLREQGEEQPAGQDPGAAPPEEAPPPPAKKDPVEKMDQAQNEDLAEFRKKHAGIIYRVSRSRDQDDYGRNSSIRSLQSKFEDSGIDEPFFMLFDPETTGLRGRRHLALIASLLHNGRISGGRAKFRNAGDASLFAEKVPEIRDDLAFEVGEQDPTTVTFKRAEAEEPEAPAPEAAAPPAPQEAAPPA